MEFICVWVWMTENSSCGGMAAGFVFNPIHYSAELNESRSLMKHTVAAQSFLTSRLFSHSIAPHLFIHCSSHSLLPPPPPTNPPTHQPPQLHQCRRPIVGPAACISEPDARHNGDIDTGDPIPPALPSSRFPWNINVTRHLRLNDLRRCWCSEREEEVSLQRTVNIDKDPASLRHDRVDITFVSAGFGFCFFFMPDAVQLRVLT